MKKLCALVLAGVLLAAVSASRGVGQEPAGRAELDAAHSKAIGFLE